MDTPLEPAHLVALAWLVAGLVLSAIETLAPGAFFIWFGAAAAIVGAVDYFLPMGFVAQLILFAVLVAALVLIGRRVYGSLDKGPGPLPQSRAHAMVGADFFLDEPIARGYGRIRVGQLLARRRTGLPSGRHGEGGRRGAGLAVACRAGRLTLAVKARGQR
jgi:membrane protein implicated in regulation of membrane protease activity